MSVIQFPAAGLDVANGSRETVFDRHRDSKVFFPVHERPVAALVTDSAGNPAGLPIHEHKATLRETGDGRLIPLGIVGKGYKVTPFADLTARCEEGIASQIDDRLLDGVKIDDRVSRDGAWVQRSYEFPRVSRDILQRSGNLKVGTTVSFRASVSSTYDGSGSGKLVTGALDLWCTNGCATWHKDVYSRRHTSGFSADEFGERIVAAIESFKEAAEIWQAWADTQVTDEQVAEAIAELPGVSERRAARLIERAQEEIAERGANVYAVYSALTWFASHPEDERFGVRQTGNDNVAETLARRQLDVAAWVRSEPWQRLAQAA